MPTEMKQKRQWVYRPSDEEHEKLLRFMAENPEYTSTAQVVREGVLRLSYGNDKKKIFSMMDELIEDMKKQKDKFLKLILEASD
jgi:hypothetical protein